MATKKERTMQADEGYAEEVQAEQAPATEPAAVKHRTTVPQYPQLGAADAFGVIAANRIRSLLQHAAYSREADAAASALIQLGHQNLPATASPALRQYLAEATDYLQGKAQA